MNQNQLTTMKNEPEHNPDNLTPEQVGEGWRLLRKDEKVEKGDQFWCNANNEWLPAFWRGAPVTDAYRRRVAPEQALKGGDEPCPTETTRSGCNAPVAVQSGDMGPATGDAARIADEDEDAEECDLCKQYAEENAQQKERIAELERQLAEARETSERRMNAWTLELQNLKVSEDENAALRTQLAASEKDRDATVSAFLDSAEVWDLLTASPLTLANAGRGLRALGHDIPQKMEQECGYVLRLALHKIVKHGPEWRKAFAAEFDAAMKEAR